ncbi:unnamed protein product [Caenorhabditis angaria]|uniref:Malate synthase n=1 Tax=Caenorhabditis angaria TaxID=860376 RepID=A0A9P1IUA9_9PELO|nr:unnamed protein product [Caenorhabditis angaria]
MADFEDSNSPTWRNQLEGQINLYDAARGNISYVHPTTKKEYTLANNHAVLKVRPRGFQKLLNFWRNSQLKKNFLIS